MDNESLINIIRAAVEEYPSIAGLLTETESCADNREDSAGFESLCREGLVLFEKDTDEQVVLKEQKCLLYVSGDNETIRINILCPHDRWIVGGITQRPIEIASLFFEAIHGKKSLQSGTLLFWSGDSLPINDETGSYCVMFGTQGFLSERTTNPFSEYYLIIKEILKRFTHDETVSSVFSLQGSVSDRIKKLCDEQVLCFSHNASLLKQVKVLLNIECNTDYTVSWDILGYEEDLLWTISDSIENMMSSFSCVKPLHRGDMNPLNEEIRICSSSFTFKYSPDALCEVVDKKDRIRKKPNFFCDIDVLNALINREYPSSDSETEFTVSLLELPLWLSFSQDNENQVIRVYPQHEIFTRDESMTHELGHLVINKATGEGRGTGTEELKESSMTVFFRICQCICGYIQEENISGLFARLDPDKSGILISVNEDKIFYRVVSGKDRPNLTCKTLTGEVVLGRPYTEDFLERSFYDLKSWDEILELAENGDIKAMDKIAMTYLNGGDGVFQKVEQDPEKAVFWFEKMAEAGVSNGMFNLGLHYAKGYGVQRDFDRAAAWMEKAEDAGDTDAARLATEYRKLSESIKKAEAGDAGAQAALAAGYMALGGSLDQAGAGEDYAESIKWAHKAAAQGSGEGIWTLALAYEHGRGVEKDIEKAVQYYEQGANLGHLKCQHSLGCYYMRGEIFEEDHKKAFDLFLKSAEQGYGLAMRDVGRCYQFGSGVMGNMKKAVEWYEKACEVLDDPELAEKTEIFKSISKFDEHWGEDYPGDFDEEGNPIEDTEPDKYLTGIVPEAVSEAWRYEDELDKQGFLPDEPHGDEAWGELPRVHRKAEEGDPKGVEILKALENIKK